MIPKSLRGQLTLWYTGVLAVVLIAFALAAYQYLAHAAQQRTDRSLADSTNAFLSTLTTESNDENQSATAAAEETTTAFRFPDRQVIVFDQQQRVIAASRVPQNISEKAQWFSPIEVDPEFLKAVAKSGERYLTLGGNARQIRIFATATPSSNETVTIVMAQSMREQTETLAQARRAFLIAVPLALVLASLGGYFLARKSLAPVMAISDQAARISVANLNERLPVSDSGNELNDLARTFNDLLARLDRSFDQQRRFMADASHELRTPVAIVCGESEVALSVIDRSPEDYRESLKIVQAEGRRLTRVVEDLFTLARADAGQYSLVVSDLYLDETVADWVYSVRSLASQKGLNLYHESNGEEMPYRGDEALLRRMVLNLLDNSIKYTPAGGNIRIDLRRDGARYLIVVADTGAGIPAEAQPHIFERFFRADKARSRNQDDHVSGAGLGLSIASWVAEMHRGSITLDHSDQNGTSIIVSLPIG
jgi:heavy metal sensor kinase